MANSGVLAVARQRGFSVVRANMERALGRLRAGSWPVVQTAVAAALAWSAGIWNWPNGRSPKRGV